MGDELLRRLLDSYRDAIAAKDARAFASIFADEVRVFDMWNVWSYDGIEPWRAMAADWFGSLGDERVAVTFDGVRSTMLGDDAACLSCFVVYAAIGPDGDTRRSLRNRLSWVLRRIDGRWQVVHEHSSAPLDIATGKLLA